MKEELVSIAIATYNGAGFLREQLDSIYRQTYKNIEVVVCDDMSDDGTVDILDEYSRKYGLIFHRNETRLGYLKNFEKCIKLCRGDFVALADQDDLWFPHKIETMLKNRENKPLICSDMELISDTLRIISNSYIGFMKKKIPGDREMFIRLIFDNFFPGCSMMFHRNLLERIIPIPGESLHHDWWISIQASLSGGIKYISEPLMQYRQHQRNTIGSKRFSGVKYNFDRIYYIFADFKTRRKQIREKFNRLDAFMQYNIINSVYNDESQLRALEVAHSYYASYGKGLFNFMTVYIGMKYGDLIYWPKPFLKRMVQSIAKIF